jgi:hypothetical protein
MTGITALLKDAQLQVGDSIRLVVLRQLHYCNNFCAAGWSASGHAGWVGAVTGSCSIGDVAS